MRCRGRKRNIRAAHSPYSASKKAAEALCYTYHYLYDIDVTVFRYFTVYGPAGRPDMSLFRFVQWISEGHPVTVFGDGRQSRDFTYVRDIARGTIAGLQPVGYEVINLGSDEPVVLIEAIHLIEELGAERPTCTFKSATSPMCRPRGPISAKPSGCSVGARNRALPAASRPWSIGIRHSAPGPAPLRPAPSRDRSTAGWWWREWTGFSGQ
ncbi:MAG: NAD-dependent epimerase/dehydratase family protein [Caldilineaceae bacterium]